MLQDHIHIGMVVYGGEYLGCVVETLQTASFRVRTVRENLEKSWNSKKGYFQA